MPVSRLPQPSVQTIVASFTAPVLTVTGNDADGLIAIGRTLAGSLLVNGTAVAGAPTVTGTTLVRAYGLGGDDVISLDEGLGVLPSGRLHGGFGNDTVIGGSSSDQIFGEAGDDTLLGRGGADIVNGGDGGDTLLGGTGSDQLLGEGGDDRMIWSAGDGSDLHQGGAGRDTTELNGDAGAESFTARALGAGVQLLGAAGAGTFILEMTDTEILVVTANAGADAVAIGDMTGTALRRVTINLGADGAADSLSLDGTGGDDRIAVTTSGRIVAVTGLAAQVEVTGRDAGGRDRIDIMGLDGDDTIDLTKPAGSFAFFADGGGGEDDLQGSAGGDTLFGGAGADFIAGLGGDDVLRGGADDDVMLGGLGSDVMFGDAGHDVLDGGLGDDVLVGGTGDDVLLGGGGIDIFIPSVVAGETTIRDFGADDRLDLSAFGAIDAASLAASARSAGDGLVIDLGGSHLLLEGVDLAALTAGEVLL